jgi:transposase
MEAASDYRKPVYFLLEREGFDCLLCQASQVKALPGRPKTGRLDSVWLAGVTGQGSLAGSFVPPGEIRRLRTHTRCRRRLVQVRTAEKQRCEKQRCEKLPEDARLKLPGVISDIHGVSGRDMLAAIIAGGRTPAVLAELARGAMRRKLSRLAEAPDCSFVTEEHAFILQMMPDSIDHHTAQIAVPDEKIAVLCEPCERQIAQPDSIPGFGVTTAQELIAETGVDMSAASAGRTQTFPGAKLRRPSRHMPGKKARGAIMPTQLVIARGLLPDPAAEYRDLGPGCCEQRAGTRRQAHGHVRGLERLGYKVTIEPPGPETGELMTRTAS